MSAYRQEPPAPRKAVTRRPLSLTENFVHLILTVCTGGVWGFVWAARRRSHKAVTKYR